VLQVRVEAARHQLERSNGGLKHVASVAGFGSADAMRRAFVRLLGITPRRYRELAARPTDTKSAAHPTAAS
jgi:transcriptional regulator GlxA family with amidase domain